MRLFLIITAQFLSGSIWFAANVAYQGQNMLLSAVQLGFITGTLGFAFFNISDRFSPAKVFFWCALAGAVFNFSGIFLEHNRLALLVSRTGCGICLAGIYPVGMKIAASWYPGTLSKALGWMVGALVLASGLPYLINMMAIHKNAGTILCTTSILCLAGGIIQAAAVGDGPFLPKGSAFDIMAVKKIFRHPGFRAASFGYFGHMWELYAVYAHVPVLIRIIEKNHSDFVCFMFFAAGFAGCAAGGIIALKSGSRIIAMAALCVSGIICLVSPFITDLPEILSIGILMLWGIAVVADSPQFSALNTKFAPQNYVGSALTIVNCIGFSITIFSIELVGYFIDSGGIRTAFLPLAIGPAAGLAALQKYKTRI